MNENTPWRNGQKKRSLDEGLLRLTKRQNPGESFTPAEIAAECDVHPRAILFIERRAKMKLARGLHLMNPGFFAEILGNRPITEVFERLGNDPYRTGKPNRRPKKEQKKKQVDSCETTMTEVVRILQKRNTRSNWRTARRLRREAVAAG